MGVVLGAASQQKVVLAMVLLFVVHLAGIAVLVSMMGRDVLEMFRTSPYSDDDDGGGPPPADDPVVPTTPTGGGLPLPDAEQAPRRLREPGRLADHYPRTPRRPDHAPAPVREPVKH
ncbi:MAG TPA: hypothetical protein VN238_12895 [Solirubrobacteraceae bacterium]|nr:hypothetical protein [Solirubrobacteraceae bacterium]